MSQRSTKTRGTRVGAYVLAALSIPAIYDYAATNVVNSNWLYYGIGLLGCLAVLIGVRIHRPAQRWAWYLIVLGNLSFITGDIIYNAQDAAGGAPFPGPADIPYLTGYPLIAAGLMMLRDRTKGDRGSIVDAAVLGTSASLIAWVFLMEPYATDPSISLGAKLVSIAYPAGDLILLATVAWIFLSTRTRTPSMIWLLLSTAALLGSDILYGWQSLAGTYAGGWVDAGYIFSYLTFGSAALEPSMRHRVTDQQDGRETSRRRLVLLFVAALLGPGLLGLATTQGRVVDMRVMTVGTILLFGLVLVRMWDLLKTVQRNATLLAAREAELSTTVGLLRKAEEARARLLESVMTASEQERSSIAGDLHDGPVQQLTTLSLEADIASMEITAGDMSAAAEAMVQVQNGLSNQIETLRSMMANLRPPVLDERGLTEALRDGIESFSEETGIPVTFDASIDDRPPRVIETILYRVAQEALANVRKHARATQVMISWRRSGDRLTFDMRDNGVGFDMSRIDTGVRRGHFGLSLMRERVELAGGDWTLASVPGEGTQLTAVFDLEKMIGQEATSSAR